jgi:hypothetical protein
MSIHKTIYQIFGLGPLHLFDATATDLRDMFTDKPNLAGYTHVGVPKKVFDPEVAFNPNDPKLQDRRWMKPPVELDNREFLDWLHENQYRGLSGS